MTDYPVLFRTSHLIRGPGFTALVVAEGRVRMVVEDGEWWCHGVEPGGLTESGVGPLDAFDRFRESFWTSLADLAELSADLAGFQEEAQALFAADEQEMQRWVAALTNVQQGSAIDEPFRTMPRIPARASSLKIDRIEDSTFAAIPMETANEIAALPDAA